MNKYIFLSFFFLLLSIQSLFILAQKIYSINGITSDSYSFYGYPSCDIEIIYGDVSYPQYSSFSNSVTPFESDILISGGVLGNGTYVSSIRSINPGVYSTIYFTNQIGQVSNINNIQVECVQPTQLQLSEISIVSNVTQYTVYTLEDPTIIKLLDPINYIVVNNKLSNNNTYPVNRVQYITPTNIQPVSSYDTKNNIVIITAANANTISAEFFFNLPTINSTSITFEYDFPPYTDDFELGGAVIQQLDMYHYQLSYEPTTLDNISFIGLQGNVNGDAVWLFKDDNVFSHYDASSRLYKYIFSVESSFNSAIITVVGLKSKKATTVPITTISVNPVYNNIGIVSASVNGISSNGFSLSLDFNTTQGIAPKYYILPNLQSVPLSFPYGIVGNLFNTTLNLTSYLPNMNSLSILVGSSMKSLNLSRLSNGTYDIYPPVLSNIVVDNQYLSFTVNDPSGIESCQVDFDNLHLSLSPSDADVLIKDNKQMNFKVNIASVYDPIVCARSFKILCSDKLYNRHQYKSGDTYNYQSEVEQRIPFIDCPVYNQPIPIYLRFRYLNSSTSDSIHSLDPIFQVTYLSDIPYNVIGQFKSLTNGNVISINLGDSVKLSENTFMVVSSISQLNTALLTTFEIQTLQFVAGRNTYTINSNQLSILSQRRVLPARITQVTDISNSITIVNSTDVVPPTITNLTFSIVSDNIYIDVEAKDTQSGVRDITISYFTSFDNTILNQTISTNGTAQFVLNTIPTCGFFNFFYYISSVCDNIGNCLTQNTNSIIKEQINPSLDHPSTSIEIVDYKSTPSFIYANSIDSRTVNIQVKIKSQLSPSTTSTPIIFVKDIYPWTNHYTSCRGSLIQTVGNVYTYGCSLDLPVNFGLSNQLLVSVEGFYDICGNVQSFNTNHLRLFSIIKPLQISMMNPVFNIPSVRAGSSSIVINGNMTNFNRSLLKLTSQDNFNYKPTLMATMNNLTIELNRVVSIGQTIVVEYDNFEYLLDIKSSCSSNSSCNNGTCDVSTGICSCLQGYTGLTCSKTLCPGTPICSGHGTCSPLGFCVCDRLHSGPSCNSVSNYSGDPIIQFEQTRPWCTYAINGTPTSNLTNDFSYMDQEFRYNIKFYSIIEKTPSNETVFSEIFDNMRINGSITSHFTMTSTLSNGANIIMSMLIAQNYSEVKWMNETLILHNNTVKYDIRVSNYPFRDKLNYLLITFNISSESLGKCKLEQLRSAYLYGNSFNMPLMYYGLNAQFPNKAIIDDRPFVLTNQFLQITPSLIFVGMVVPYFEQYTYIDPNFGVLVRANYNEKQPSFKFDCGYIDDDDDKRNWLIPVAVVVPIVALAILIAIIIVIYKRNVTMHIYMKKIQTKISRKNSVSMKATSFD